MGNIQSISSTEIGDKPCITETFLQNFHTHATIVDHSVAALARAIDAMVSSCTRDFNKQEGAPQSGEKLLMSVLKATQDCIGDLKIVVTESVRNLLCFIIEECLGHSENVGKMCSSLSVYKYLQHIPEKVDGDDVVRLCKKSLNELKTECSSLRDIISLKSETINNLEEREALYLKEIDFFREKISKLETGLGSELLLTPKEDIIVENKSVDDNIDNIGTMEMKEQVSEQNDLKSVHDILSVSRKDTTIDLDEINKTVDMRLPSLILETPKEDISVLRSDYERMKTEYEALKRKIDLMERKLMVQVQVYHEYTFLSYTLEKELISRLRGSLDDRGIELKVTNRESESAVNQNNLLLICFDYTSNHASSSANIIKKVMTKFQDSSKTALLLFHRTDEAGFNSQVEQFSDENHSFGAVFHAGYSPRTMSAPTSVLNETVVNQIADFVLSKGDVKPKYNTMQSVLSPIY